jgi:bacterioferritin-associated ferredoxin
MIVCLCRGVSEGEIRAVVASGARCAEAVTDACGAGGDCGSCILSLIDLLAESDTMALTPGGRR